MILDSKRNTSPRIAPMRMGAPHPRGASHRGHRNRSRTSTGAQRLRSIHSIQPGASRSRGGRIREVENYSIDTDTLLADATDVHVEINTTDSADELDRPKEKPARSSGSESRNENRRSTVTIRSAGGEVYDPPERHHALILGAPTPAPHPAPHPDARPIPTPPKPPRIGSAAMAFTEPAGEERSLDERMRRLEKLVESLVHKPTNPELIDPQFHFRFEGLGKSIDRCSRTSNEACVMPNAASRKRNGGPRTWSAKRLPGRRCRPRPSSQAQGPGATAEIPPKANRGDAIPRRPARKPIGQPRQQSENAVEAQEAAEAIRESTKAKAKAAKAIEKEKEKEKTKSKERVRQS